MTHRKRRRKADIWASIAVHDDDGSHLGEIVVLASGQIVAVDVDGNDVASFDDFADFDFDRARRALVEVAK